MPDVVFQSIEDKSSIELCDGTNVLIRHVQPDDAPRLQALYRHLSPSSAFFRFMACWKELPLERAAYLTQVDYRTRMAFVAVLKGAGEGQVIGLASYACIGPYANGVAEAAVVVIDRYQGLGLGTALLEHLAAFARTCVINIFVGTVHRENTHLLRWLENKGLKVRVKQSADEASDMQIWIDLVSPINLPF